MNNMNNVLFVDFGNQSVLGNQIKPGQFATIQDYFGFLYELGLDEFDMLDLNDAIKSFAFYQKCDSVIQDLANFWFSHSGQFEY